MIETVVQNEYMLCSRIIDKSNLDSAFLKIRTSPICRKAIVCLSIGTLDNCSELTSANDVVKPNAFAPSEMPKMSPLEALMMLSPMEAPEIP